MAVAAITNLHTHQPASMARAPPENLIHLEVVPAVRPAGRAPGGTYESAVSDGQLEELAFELFVDVEAALAGRGEWCEGCVGSRSWLALGRTNSGTRRRALHIAPT